MVNGLYQRLLGSSWPALAAPVQAFHAADVRGRGRFQIRHGRGWPARVLARLCHLPRANEAAETELAVTSRGGEERWSRTFDGLRLESWQFGAGNGDLIERFRVFEPRFRLEARHGALVYRPLGASLVFGAVRVRLPAFLAPRIEAREDPAGDRQVRVHVCVILPMAGPVLTYDGIIDLAGTRA